MNIVVLERGKREEAKMDVGEKVEKKKSECNAVIQHVSSCMSP